MTLLRSLIAIMIASLSGCLVASADPDDVLDIGQLTVGVADPVSIGDHQEVADFDIVRISLNGEVVAGFYAGNHPSFKAEAIQSQCEGGGSVQLFRSTDDSADKVDFLIVSDNQWPSDVHFWVNSKSEIANLSSSIEFEFENGGICRLPPN